MKVIVPRIRRIIVEKGNRKMGVTIAYTEDLEMGKYTCAFSFLSPEDNHCKRIGREKAIERFVKGETVEVDADLDLKKGEMNSVNASVMHYFWNFVANTSLITQIKTENKHHYPRWMFKLLQDYFVYM